VVIQNKGQQGSVVVKATSEGLKASEVKLDIR
jgi:hypothetical protein